MKNRIVGLLLAVAMLVGMLPLSVVTAAAEEEAPVTEYYALDVGSGAYIDTKFTPDKDTRIVMDVELNNQMLALFGFILNTSPTQDFYVNSGGTGYGSGYGHIGRWTNDAPVTGRQKVEFDKNKFKIDGVVKDTFDYVDFQGQSMYLFGIHIDDWAQSFENQFIRFYSCEIYENDVLKHEFVPAKQNDEFGVCDKKDNNKFYKNQGNGHMVGYKKVNAGGTLSSGSEGVILDFTGTVTVSENTTIYARPGQSGIVIAGGREVTINIKENVTLTVNGGAADGRIGGGAGIEVPESSSLTVCGEGRLKARGGDAADGERGKIGGDGTVEYYWCHSGAGGNGGNGGGGAGAGIGGRGGYGGLGGAGGASVAAETYTSTAVVSGLNGSNGADGVAGGACGNITICRTLAEENVYGGIGSYDAQSGGDFGDMGIDVWSYYYLAFAGGGGGGGGGGYPAADIGSGGGGAGGGGGGGSGLIINWYYKSDAYNTGGTGHGGFGGGGGVTSNKGGDSGIEVNTAGLVAGAGGLGGVGAGDGVEKTDVHYYYEPAVLPQPAENLVYDGNPHDGLTNLVDFGSKYTLSGETSATDAGEHTATARLKNGYCWSDGKVENTDIVWYIAKQQVTVPSSVSLHYTGYERTAFQDSEDGLYTVKDASGTDAKTYEAALTLTYPNNYTWENDSNATTHVPFNIHRYEDKNGVCKICGGSDRYLYDIPYLDSKVIDSRTGVEEKICVAARVISQNDTEWGMEGQKIWYIVDDAIVLTERPAVKGDVCIILMNGKTLTANHGITVEGENSVSFYAQSDDEDTMGKLTAVTSGVTAIGGNNGADSGAVAVYGGKLLLESEDAACIGSGNNGAISFYGGCSTLKSNTACIGGENSPSILGTPVIKAGSTEQTAEDITVYGGEKYLLVKYHSWLAGTGEDCLYHICKGCNEKERHIPDENGVCVLCGSPFVTIFSEQPATSDRAGRLAYYQCGDKYYEDICCTQEIANLKGWLHTNTENGGGRIPPLADIGDSDGNVIIPKVSVSSSRVVYTADAINHRQTGNTIVKATPSGIAELLTYDEPGPANRDLYYAGETPEAPTIVLTSDRKLDENSLTVTPLNGNDINVVGAFIGRAGSAYTYTWYITQNSGTVDDGQKHLDFRIDYSYTYASGLTDEDITNHYSAYCTFAVEQASQPGGVYVWRSTTKPGFNSETLSCYAVRILGANTFGSFYETGSAPEATNWSHGYAKFTEQNDLTGDTGYVSIPDGAPGYGTVIYSAYRTGKEYEYLNTALDRYRPVSTVYVDKSKPDLASYDARLSVVSLGTVNKSDSTYNIAGIKALTGEVEFSADTSSEIAAYAQLGLPKFSPTPDFADGKQISTVTNYETDFFGTFYTHNDKKVTLDNGNTMYPYTLIASVGSRYHGTGVIPSDKISNNDVAIDYRIVTYDKSVLRKLLEDIDAKGGSITSSQFYSDSAAFDAFIAALQNAQYVLNDSDTDQNTIDAAAEALRTALAGLEGKVAEADYSAVDAAIARASELEPGQYTRASWSALVNAIGAVETGCSRFYQTAVDKMALDIEAAIDGLKQQPAHTHAFSDAWTTDETAHWHECTAEDCVIEAYSTCGIADAAYGEHTPDKDGICTVCQKSLVYKIAKEAATCQKTGHLAYYRNGAKYYKNQSYTQEIIDITEWLNTDVSNGGGRIPVTGHTWESASATQHRCVYCNTTEDHSFTGDECTVCGKIARYGYYIDRHWDAQNKRVISEEVKIPEDAMEIKNFNDSLDQGDLTLSGGWYVVSKTATIPFEHIFIYGTPENPTNLILEDGCYLTLKRGVIVGETNALNIYGQAGGSGVLESWTGAYDNGAALGGEAGKGTGNITMYSGNVFAHGREGNAAIGGGENGYGGNITVYGGGIAATVPFFDGAAIGNGKNGYGCNVTIYGGNVAAEGYGKGAAIGGGYCDSSDGRYTYDNSNIAIYGGDITAESKGGGAGIGSGKTDGEQHTVNGITVRISGGNVRAIGNEGAAGIGSDSTGAGDAVNVELIIENSENMTIKAGDTAADAAVTANQYIASRSRYVQINQRCEEHHFINYTCEFCGLADLEQAKLDAYAAIDAVLDENEEDSVKVRADETKEKIGYRSSLAMIWETCNYFITNFEGGFSVIMQDAKAATCTEPGWAEHYKRGDKLYEDEGCHVVIPNLKLWSGYIPATGIHTDGDRDGKCDGCGCDLSCIKSASLILNGKIDISYAVALPEDCEEPVVTFTGPNGNQTVTDYTEQDGLLYFTYTGITPQCMGDTVTAVLTAERVGETETLDTREYSVRQYCENMLAKTDDEKLITLLSDMLTYGAAAQTYVGYKTDALVTNGLTLTPSTFEALSDLAPFFTGAADEDTFWQSAGLTLNNSVAMSFTFYAESADDLTVKVSVNGREQIFTAEDFTAVDGRENTYRITFRGIMATEFADAVTAEFLKDGKQVGNTLSYTVNTYICAKQADANAALADLVKALYCYGASAKAYKTE